MVRVGLTDVGLLGLRVGLSWLLLSSYSVKPKHVVILSAKPASDAPEFAQPKVWHYLRDVYSLVVGCCLGLQLCCPRPCISSPLVYLVLTQWVLVMVLVAVGALLFEDSLGGILVDKTDHSGH